MKTDKPTLTLRPGGRQAAFEKDTLLLDALFEMGVMVKTPCGGKGICGKCAVRAEGSLSPRTDREKKLFPDDENTRLACVTTLRGDASAWTETAETPAHTVTRDISVGPAYGIALDIGTTTVQFSLVDLDGGETHRFPSLLNPQRRWGHDVISRIAAAGGRDAAEQLTRAIRGAIESSVIDTQKALSLPREGLRALSFSGNTVMSYLLLGLDVAPIGVFPYTAAVRDFDGYDIPLAGIDGRPAKKMLPVAASFLGGDLVGGLAVSDLAGYRARTLFIVLGTNGELFLRNGGGEIHAASCAMGPALEGMNMSYGMTADEGAIAHLKAGPGGLVADVLGEGPALGICGTGIIDAIALLLREGLIKTTGAFVATGPGENRLFPDGVLNDGGTKRARLAGDVFLSQKDIRNVQLAKGASLAAGRILLREAGILPEEIEHVLIAGAFGENLDIENFRALKFLPDFPNAEYVFLGNTSLTAAEEACRSEGFLDHARSLRDRVKVVELSEDPAFNDEFVRCLDF